VFGPFIAALLNLHCLTDAVYFEARGEPTAGQAAVALVIMNRVADPAFPDDACSVIRQPGQFSFKPGPIDDPEAYQRAADVAILVAAHWVTDFTNGSIYYANPKRATHRKWLRSLHRIMQIGEHVFYKK
jgi:spore germination cell wall hydrolase CwlJ-like protein